MSRFLHDLVYACRALRRAPGLVHGVAAALLATRALRGVLFGTSPTDPIVVLRDQ